ncbi:DUF4394 domain-containing protein [Dyadobacter sp. CY323]|uniref:DUF4394 domain-containing protein n=1 Tax=Dyadobacter sp. CY323 TaxID=2907302 RepID=UPI001F368744|nr:DUF4394 domain-containing protein [Dyadobacter sp. CY323]MCE6989422.1 DUF4394 domain-containing protein [Dyadobacter sp. CY323]
MKKSTLVGTSLKCSLVFALALLTQSCQEENQIEKQSAASEQQNSSLRSDASQVFYALTDNNTIYELNVQSPGTPIRTLTISGLEPNEKLLGIDFRPATGQLYAVGNKNHLYTINLRSDMAPGRATIISPVPFNPGISGPEVVGFDFNPTVDKIRLVSNTSQNYRLHPETGAIVAVDGYLKGYTNVMVGAAAYTNNFSGATTTQLYDIDPGTDKLYLQTPPNDGVLQEVGVLGMDVSAVGGFDIAAGSGMAIASVLSGGMWNLVEVNLSNGSLTSLGTLPSGKITGIAIPTNPVAYAVDASNKLIIFNPMNVSGTRVEKMITGLPTGVTIEGIDIRPADGRLYAFGSDTRLYTVDLGSGVSRFLVELRNMDDPTFKVTGTSFGVDFNPVSDRLRVVTNTGQNLRINVANGITIVDGALNLIPGPGTPVVNGAAYTNSFAGTAATVLYDLDSESNTLFKQNPPNNGGLEKMGALGVDFDAANGFDIGNATGTAYTLLTVGGSTGLYTINLTSGAAMKISDFAGSVKGFALGSGL